MTLKHIFFSIFSPMHLAISLCVCVCVCVILILGVDSLSKKSGPKNGASKKKKF